MATTAPALDAEYLAAAEPSQAITIWRRFRKHKLALAGLIALSTLTLMCIFAFIVSPLDPNYQTLSNTYAGPLSTDAAGRRHLMGTDQLGRDLFTRLLYAGRISLLIGTVTTVIVIVIGTLVGLVAGYFGGVLDNLMMRTVDLLLALPFFPILLVISQMMSRQKNVDTVVVIIAVLAVLGWLDVSRLVRGTVLSLRDREFIEATRALGAGSGRILFRHLLPNSLAPIIVVATLDVGGFILSESALSFLGFGVQPPTPTWGNMLQEVNEAFLQHPFLAFYPGLAILITVVSINFIGDALRDALDPRLKM